MRRKIPLILCFLLAVILIFASLNRLQVEPAASVRQETSVVDLRGFDFARDIVLVTSYTGNREYYPNQFYGPADFAAGAVVPPRPYDARDITTVQYGTLRLKLLLPPGYIGHAWGIAGNSIEYSEVTYIDGRPAGQVGTPGKTKETTTPQVVNRTYFFTPQREEVEIIRQYANFNHREGGGSTRFYIGKAENVDRMNRLNAVSVCLVAGCMLTIFIFYAGMFLLYNRRGYYLWFALCCLLIGVRTLGIVHFFEMVRPNLNWHLQMTVQYLMRLAIPATFVAYLHSLMPGLMNRWILRAYFGWLALYAAVVLCSEPILFTRFSKINQLGIGVFLLYVFARLTMNLRNRKPDEALVFAGAAVFAVCWLGDTLYYRFASMQVYVLFLEDLSQPGMMACVYINMVALALQFSRTENELSLVRLRERELDATNAMLDRLNRMKTEFMQNITHEMRTPLTAISVYAQLAAENFKKGEPDARAGDDFELVSREAERLAEMTEGLLDMALVQENRAGGRPVRIGEVITGTARLYQVILARRHNTLAVEVEEDLPLVSGNADELTQVVLNLLANAAAHTEGGRITVTARRKGEAHIEVTVADTGRGIAPELLPHIFERFAGSGGGGRGLGLHICHEIVEAHDGTMEAESEPGAGTTVRFVLPLLGDDS